MSPPVQQTIRETEIEASVLAGPGGSAWHASRALWAAQGTEKERARPGARGFVRLCGWNIFCFVLPWKGFIMACHLS